MRVDRFAGSAIVPVAPALALFALAAGPAAGAPGDLDEGFGNAGFVVSPALGVAFSVALQPDGKIVASGYSSQSWAVARYLPDGSLDPSFGIGGFAAVDIEPGFDDAHAVLIQPDGKIVTVGAAAVEATDRNPRFAVVRHTPDGSLDASFGEGGIRTTRFFSLGDVAKAGVLQPDGKIVAAGRYNKVPNSEEWALARYDPDGSLDLDFGILGLVSWDDPGSALAVGLQPDGKIVAAGYEGRRVSVPGFGDMFLGLDFGLRRYNPDGTPDFDFGSSGRVATDVGGTGIADQAEGLVLQPDGKIVVVGIAAIDRRPEHYSLDFALARYLPDGSLDPTFGTGGLVITDIGSAYDHPLDLALQDDGKLLAVGLSYWSFATGVDFVAARYLPDGSLDPGFGVGGRRVLAFPGGDHFDAAEAVVLQSDGKAILAGHTKSGGGPAFGLLRLYTRDPVVGVGAPAASPPSGRAIVALHPNPLPGVAWITFRLPDLARATMTIHDVRGRRLRSWSVEGAGLKTLLWDGRDASARPVPAGVYVVRLEQRGEFLDSRRAVVLR